MPSHYAVQHDTPYSQYKLDRIKLAHVVHKLDISKSLYHSRRISTVQRSDAQAGRFVYSNTKAECQLALRILYHTKAVILIIAYLVDPDELELLSFLCPLLLPVPALNKCSISVLIASTHA